MSHSMKAGMVAAMFTLVAGASSGFAQQVDPSDMRETARELQQAKLSLGDAIKTAEKHCGGTAVSALVLTNPMELDQFSRYGSNPEGDAVGKSRSAGANLPNRDNVHAAVTCVVNDVQFRRLLVDLNGGRVIRVDNDSSFAHGYGYGVDTNRDRWERDRERWERDRDGDRHTDRDQRDRWNDDRSVNRGQHEFRKVSDLLNLSATNRQDQDLGDIDDIAIDMQNKRAVYGVLKRGGLLGFGSDSFAIPISEFDNTYGREVVLDVTARELEDRDGFDTDNWPKEADWHWSRTGELRDRPAAVAVTPASEIISKKLYGSDDKEVGAIRELILDVHTGRLAYAAVEVNDKLVYVPCDAITMSQDKPRVAKTRKDFEALSAWPTDREPDWYSARWNRSVAEEFGVNPYWLRDSSIRDRESEQTERRQDDRQSRDRSRSDDDRNNNR